jgi:hypothetical protein
MPLKIPNSRKRLILAQTVQSDRMSQPTLKKGDAGKRSPNVQSICNCMGCEPTYWNADNQAKPTIARFWVPWCINQEAQWQLHQLA